MKFTPLGIPEVLLIEPDVHRDDRGFFLETYHRIKYEQGGLEAEFAHDTPSRSQLGTLRGLHAQVENAQGKLVRAVQGEVFDVAVDIRRGSPHFGRWVGERLSAQNFKQLWIPPGFAHGVCVTTETAEFEYKCTDFYHPESEIAIAWDDPKIGIEWPITSPQLSAKDASARSLEAMNAELPIYEGSR